MDEFTKELVSLRSELFVYARKLTSGDAELADDLVQDTMLKALNHRDKFKEGTNLRAWVFTIIYNNFINGYREKIRHGEGYSDLVEVIFPAEDDPHEDVEIAEIEAFLDELPAREKFMIKMLVRGYTYEEITNILGIPMGTVKSAIFFARAKLREAMDE